MDPVDGHIKTQRELVRELSLNDAERAMLICDLALAHAARYAQRNEYQDITECIELYDQLASLTLSETTLSVLDQRPFAFAFNKQYVKTGDLQFLEKAIKIKEQRLRLVSSDSPEHHSLLESLFNYYGDRYDITRNSSDLDRIIQIHQEIISCLTSQCPDRAHWMASLGIWYMESFKKTRRHQILQKSIDAREEALRLSNIGDIDHPARIRSLAAAYEIKYHENGVDEDLCTAIRLHQEALDALEQDDSERQDYLMSLGMALGKRHKRTYSIEDLENSLRLYHEALDWEFSDARTKPDIMLNLGVGYGDLHRWSGDMIDLERSIQFNQEAADLAAIDSSPDRKVDILHNLAVGYGNRYERLGAMADLERSIQLKEELAGLTPVGHRDRDVRLRALAFAYQMKGKRTKNEKYMQKALHLVVEVLELTPPGHPERADRVQELGNIYTNLYRLTKDSIDLEKSVQLKEEGLDILRSRNAAPALKADFLHRLYNSRVEQLVEVGGTTEDLAYNVKLCQEALDATAQDHFDRAVRLKNLASSYEMRYHVLNEDQGAAEDLSLAIHYYHESLNCTISQTSVRLRAGRSLIHLLAENKDWKKAYEAAVTTMNLVPSLNSRFLDSSDRQHLVMEVDGLASNAAAIALHNSRSVYEAINFLETGRGMITGSLHELRADVAELNQLEPQLAEKFLSLRDQLVGRAEPHEKQDNRRYDAAKTVDQLMGNIRSLPGMESFLLCPTEKEILDATIHGPIVVINASIYRCDALIAHNNSQLVVPLPQLYFEDIRRYLTGDLSRKEVLEWLWHSLAEPVLQAMGYTSAPLNDEWPRVWWIPVGLLARFPIHAAGLYSESSCTTVLDRVISSYNSSIRTLLNGRRRNPIPITLTPETRRKVTLVGVAHAPGFNRLPKAVEEVEELERLCREMGMQVKIPSADYDSVVDGIRDCDIFHFAGHGMTDPTDPLRSCLLLLDWRKKPLRVSDLLEANLCGQMPFLAYLSACGTGQVKRDDLIDESIHLISAFQLAGFQHVIGSLWEVNDEMCAKIAAETYKIIRQQGLRHSAVAKGLHMACRRLRQAWMTEALVEMRQMNVNGQIKPIKRNGVSPPETAQSKKSDTRVRDIEPCGDDEFAKGAYWVPFVHFGT